ncbi:MAG: phosphoribosylamine--glycine ligase [Candidatus Kaiserbacteria bacterium]|nr:MAG: phosphoribosylamine--glycine ligase [Candidatus Kaiserbacteria bacterium]
MDVLLVGGGGREHAIAWKLKQSPRLGKLFIAPGNGGTRLVGENVPIGAMEFEKLANFAEEKKIGLTICTMDDPLVEGIVDFFQSRGLRIWGPSKAAAQLEGSKAFSKLFMQEAGIPTAEFGVFTEYEKALDYVRAKGAPIVVKASGLALGKGVTVCTSMQEAEAALEAIFVKKLFGDSGKQVVIEEFLDGPEISIHAISDGNTYTMFPPSQDHKRALDHDEGKNTGGMGVIAPLPFVDESLTEEIERTIVRPTFEALKKRGILFSGVLYPGLILSKKGPKVLEYNARFGDPETQVYMRLLKTDVLDICEACVDGTLADQPIEWLRGFAANIVLASGGYPDEYKKGVPIGGIEEAEKIDGIVVFHAGTTFDGELKTNGGRVLGVSAIGKTLKEALDTAYEAVEKIQFEGKQFRRDIGTRIFQI